MIDRAQLRVIRGGLVCRSQYIEFEHPVPPPRLEHVEPDHAGPGLGYALFIAACFTALCAGIAMVVR